MGFKRYVAAAIALAVLIGGLTLFLIFNEVSTLGAARGWVEHTRDVLQVNQQLRASVQQAEDGERGFLITHDPAYLAPYAAAEKDLGPEETRLARLVTDNTIQTRQVRALIDAVERRRRIIDRVVATARSGDFEAARALIVGGQGRTAMGEIDACAAKVAALEDRLLAQRTADARNSQALTLATGLAVSFVALLALTAGVVVLARTNRRLGRAIVEQREAESAQAAVSALAHAIFVSVPDYLMVLNVEAGDRFVVADVNPAFERALNFTAASVRGRALDELLPEALAPRLIGHYRRVREGGKPVTRREELRFPDGVRIWESIVAPVPASDGAGERIIGSIRDITDRVRAQERLQESQRMEAIGQLTGGVAHDFNNLLQVIRGNLELLQRSVAGDERAELRLKNALYGAERGAQLTRQLLAFARRQPLEPKVVNLSRLVSDMADLLRRTLGESIEVETVVAGGLWNTIADPAQVESALLNLALNARDAMPAGGRLTVEITNTVLDEAYAREARDVTPGQYVMLAVTDTGDGMSEAVRARVFEPFFTTKTEGRGTGLGLSMVYGFVKQSDGHVRIYSEPGQGTTVKIYLPRSRQPEPAPAPPPPEIMVDLGRTVLVVEDEDAVREATLAMLDELGYRCLEAADAQSALALVKSGAHVDLVFTDVVMPGPLRTRDFAQALAELRPELPILFTSGYTDNAIIHQGRLDEGVHLISKPYAKAELARRLAQLLPASAPAV